MKINYASDDQIYRRLRAEGQSGWSNEQEAQRTAGSFRRLMQVGGLPSHGSHPELGCGAGDLALNLAGSGFELHGVDVSPTASAWIERSCCVAHGGVGRIGAGHSCAAWRLVLGGAIFP